MLGFSGFVEAAPHIYLRILLYISRFVLIKFQGKENLDDNQVKTLDSIIVDHQIIKRMIANGISLIHSFLTNPAKKELDIVNEAISKYCCITLKRGALHKSQFK